MIKEYRAYVARSWRSFDAFERVAAVLMSPVWAPIGLVVLAVETIITGIARGLELLGFGID